MSAERNIVVSSSLLTGLFLAIRYFNAVGGHNSGLDHVHDYIGAELQRLVQVEAGGVVLATLAGALLGVKSRLSRPDGLLPLAELVLSLFNECPGLSRYGVVGWFLRVAPPRRWAFQTLLQRISCEALPFQIQTLFIILLYAYYTLISSSWFSRHRGK